PLVQRGLHREVIGAPAPGLAARIGFFLGGAKAGLPRDRLQPGGSFARERARQPAPVDATALRRIVLTIAHRIPSRSAACSPGLAAPRTAAAACLAAGPAGRRRRDPGRPG